LRKLAVSRNWKPCPILLAAAVVPPRLPVLSRLLPGTGLSRPASAGWLVELPGWGRGELPGEGRPVGRGELTGEGRLVGRGDICPEVTVAAGGCLQR
jgi:hypothetical protein